MRQPSGWPEQFRLLTRQFFDTVLDFVFPPRCVACGRVGSLFCTTCQAEISPPLDSDQNPSLMAEQSTTAEFTGPIREAIHALKYKGLARVAEPLAGRLYETLQRTSWEPTLITAIPLHPERLRSRGYNQAALLAESLARKAGLPFSGQVLERNRATPSQVGLDAAARQANVEGAFTANPALAQGQKIVVVDDVSTTGATLRACADALLSAGAQCVWGLTVARPGLKVDLASS